MREADGAFGDPTVFVEEAVIDPRHIEVQILADGEGNVIHLYERDCSLQRRHQKVVEIAPAPNLDPDLRERICADAVSFARQIGYSNAGTVEFLVSPEGRHVFIEMNPRIQVEHTVTEEVTDVDLVQSQLRIASGETLADLGLRQDNVRTRGVAMQCRITTEDPANGFRPDTGRITAYRSPGGAGIRLDGGTTYAGAEISAHFDSMLTKLTCRGRTFAMAVDRARRAVAEFRIRGVATNIPFLQAVLDDPDFRAGRVTTSFIEQHPNLLTARSSADRGTRLLQYLADVTVNRPYGQAPTRVDPTSKLPPVDLSAAAAGRLAAAAARARARGVRVGAARPDRCRGHRHHDAGRAPVAARHAGPHPRPGRRRRSHRPADARAAVAGGVGRRDVRRRAAVPVRGPVGAAGRPARGGAQHRSADAAPRPKHGRLHAVPDRGDRRLRGRGGRDRHRHLPDLRRAQRRRADAPRDRGRPRRPNTTHRRGLPLLHRRPVRPARDALHPRLLPRRWPSGSSTPAPTCWRSRTWPACCARPRPAPWSSALRERFDLPVHLHTHDTPGGQLATLLAAIDAGVDAVDAASAALAGTTSQPALSALVAGTDQTERATGLSLDGAVRPGAVLGGDPAAVRAVRVGPAGAHRAASTRTRSRAASCPTCASRRSPSASARSSSRSRTCTPRPTASSATSSR